MHPGSLEIHLVGEGSRDVLVPYCRPLHGVDGTWQLLCRRLRSRISRRVHGVAGAPSVEYRTVLPPWYEFVLYRERSTMTLPWSSKNRLRCRWSDWLKPSWCGGHEARRCRFEWHGFDMSKRT
nr:hypothetical protein CFP56_70659 [Quercus suber]